MAKYEYRIVFSDAPKLERSVEGRITVDIYLCKLLRLRRNNNYENAPEYSIIVGNAGQKRQIRITRKLWRILINTAVRTVKPLVVVKKGIGYTRLYGKEVYVEEVFAAKDKKAAKFITGEVESDKEEYIPGTTNSNVYELARFALEK